MANYLTELALAASLAFAPAGNAAEHKTIDDHLISETPSSMIQVGGASDKPNGKIETGSYFLNLSENPTYDPLESVLLGYDADAMKTSVGLMAYARTVLKHNGLDIAKLAKEGYDMTGVVEATARLLYHDMQNVGDQTSLKITLHGEPSVNPETGLRNGPAINGSWLLYSPKDDWGSKTEKWVVRVTDNNGAPATIPLPNGKELTELEMPMRYMKVSLGGKGSKAARLARQLEDKINSRPFWHKAIRLGEKDNLAEELERARRDRAASRVLELYKQKMGGHCVYEPKEFLDLQRRENNNVVEEFDREHQGNGLTRALMTLMQAHYDSVCAQDIGDDQISGNPDNATNELEVILARLNKFENQYNKALQRAQETNDFSNADELKGIILGLYDLITLDTGAEITHKERTTERVQEAYQRAKNNALDGRVQEAYQRAKNAALDGSDSGDELFEDEGPEAGSGEAAPQLIVTRPRSDRSKKGKVGRGLRKVGRAIGSLYNWKKPQGKVNLTKMAVQIAKGCDFGTVINPLNWDFDCDDEPTCQELGTCPGPDDCVTLGTCPPPPPPPPPTGGPTPPPGGPVFDPSKNLNNGEDQALRNQIFGTPAAGDIATEILTDF